MGTVNPSELVWSDRLCAAGPLVSNELDAKSPSLAALEFGFESSSWAHISAHISAHLEPISSLVELANRPLTGSIDTDAHSRVGAMLIIDSAPLKSRLGPVNLQPLVAVRHFKCLTFSGERERERERERNRR